VEEEVEEDEEVEEEEVDEDEDEVDLPLNISESDDDIAPDEDSNDLESNEETGSEDEIGKIIFKTYPLSIFKNYNFFYFRKSHRRATSQEGRGVAQGRALGMVLYFMNFTLHSKNIKSTCYFVDHSRAIGPNPMP